MDKTKISAGNYELNKFLSGGYEKDIITTLYGPGASGKTNLALIVAVSQAKNNKKVIYIDTEGGFSIDRVKQLLDKNKEVEKILQNIILLKPTTFEEQKIDFGKLLKYVKNETISLIIIDSLTMLYRLELGDAIKSGENENIREVNRQLARQLRKLNEITRKQNIPIIVINQVYNEFTKDIDGEKYKEKKVSMVGGDLLKYWSKCLIEIQLSKGKRKIILRKHRSLPEKEFAFEIINAGIKKRGMF